MIFIVSPEKMVTLLSDKGKGTIQGQLNHFVNSKDGLLWVFYNYKGLDYLCKLDPINVPMEIRFLISTKQFEILGIMENENDKQASMPVFPQMIGVN